MKNWVKQKGSVLPLALVFGSFFLVAFTGLLSYVQAQRHLSIKKAQREEAFNIAEAGLEAYRWHVINTLSGLTAEQIETYWGGSPVGVPSYEREYKDPQGTAVGKFLLEVTPPEDGSTIINVRTTGWHYDNPKVKRSIEARFRKPSWSEHVVIANDIMRFGEGTEVWGPIHSNNGIRFDGVAHNIITSSKETYWDPDTGANHPGVWTAQANPEQVFLAGTDFPVASVDFAGITGDLARIKNEAQTSGIYLDYAGSSRDGYLLDLRSDGQVDIYKVRNRGATSHHIYLTQYYKTETIPNNGVIFIEDDATIEGELTDKKVTIACADLESGSTQRDIFIENDITYTSYDGTEILGLIAQGSITIGLYSQNNLRIDGALIAQNGNVGRDYYTFWESPFYYKRDTITVNGAIATNQRYGFSWACLGDLYCSGYATRNIIYDPELIYNVPPFFPTQNSYQIDMWEEVK